MLTYRPYGLWTSEHVLYTSIDVSYTPFDLVFVLVPSPHEVEHCPIVHDVHSQSMCTTIFREVNDLYYPDCGINSY